MFSVLQIAKMHSNMNFGDGKSVEMPENRSMCTIIGQYDFQLAGEKFTEIMSMTKSFSERVAITAAATATKQRFVFNTNTILCVVDVAISFVCARDLFFFRDWLRSLS